MCTHRASRIYSYIVFPSPIWHVLMAHLGYIEWNFSRKQQHTARNTPIEPLIQCESTAYMIANMNVNMRMRIWIWMQYSLLIQSLWLSMQSLVINLQLADSNGGFPPFSSPSRYDLWPYRAAYLVVWVNETAENCWQTSWWRIFSPFVKLCNYFI